MLDLKFIRENTDWVKQEIAKLNTAAPVDLVIELDSKRRELIKQADEYKNLRNTRSKAISLEKDTAQRQALITSMQEVNAAIKDLDEKLRTTESELEDALLRIPNLPHPKVPVGPDDSANIVTKHWGERRAFSFKPKPHWELGENLGIIDFDRGVKISGTRFYVLKGLGARLQRAVITWMLDVHIQKHGYIEIYPPAMVKPECLIGTGNLPKFADNLYHDHEDDFWFIPTAEVPLTNLHRGETLDADMLPIRYVAYTPCFRKEKMSAGKETRGMKRGHQFDKVEMVKLVVPETSEQELEKLTADAEEILQLLRIPYRTVQMCTGDLSFTAAMKYDLEAWAPGVEEWLEVSSCSNFGDFQARRAQLKFKRTPAAKPELLHTLNGSGLALPRTIIAILENYQNPDGSVQIPEVLVPYMGTEVIKP